MEYSVARNGMVDSLEHDSKGVVQSEAVADAMRTVPRHEFVEGDHRAYTDQSFEHRGTRVLSPSLAGVLVEALDVRPGDSVLVVGAGVGYTVGVIAELAGARHVHAVDIARRLVYEARDNLASAGYDEVLVDCGDGARGLREYAPFDRILVEAGAVRPPGMLIRQLAEDGRLVMPLGSGAQALAAVEDGEVVEEFGRVAFDPLLVDGEQSGVPVRNRTVREDRERASRAAESRRGWEQEWIDWESQL
ncbi:protein-L-isoaspartate O-methyltransferase family protein [Halospeciosus flavus]|uniref:protein-L-isoaspartate(D-aspartate) O-methyltransferase n=1 Tax=Halospeciosus flavus TaxID=3032283 RepID=A0ABD5Z6C9_9EURY|nr:protein-L-isoaspartate O-methyltransferase [Halospeciosus flavus]